MRRSKESPTSLLRISFFGGFKTQYGEKILTEQIPPLLQMQRGRFMLTGGKKVDPLESSTQSFIIKVWPKETAPETGQAAWRGRITHVLSGVRCYVQALHEIVPFITPYLEAMGIQIGELQPKRRWYKQPKGF